jgi:hypothetical protein
MGAGRLWGLRFLGLTRRVFGLFRVPVAVSEALQRTLKADLFQVTD